MLPAWIGCFEVAARSRVCLMCAEREPLDCHRCLLVARSLAERGVAVAHILHDGAVEAHAETEQRLLALDEKAVPQACDLFTSGQHDQLAAAYRRRARAVAFRRRLRTPKHCGAFMMPALARLTVLLFLAATGSALAQDPGTVEDKTLPPLEHPGSSTPARELFGRKTTPDPATPRSIGFYSRGCLAGAVALPINGATWQVMRLSRNRNWGHPASWSHFSSDSPRRPKVDGWHGLLVGDISQPRGGPM